MNIEQRNHRGASRGGFTLIEVLVASAIIGILFVALYSGMTYGFTTIQMAREDLRATQILSEKMETIRLYNWEQLETKDFIPETFQATYYPPGQTQQKGVTYEGTMEIEDVDLDTNYDDEIKQVSIELTWITGGLTRKRSALTYVGKFGLHTHVY